MSAYDHICTDTDCPFTGQRTDRGCKCHKTPEQMRDAEIITLRERRDDLLISNNAFEHRAREAERALKALTTPRPISEYHEDMGDVLWWKFPIVEAPYVGSPNDLGYEALGTLDMSASDGTKLTATARGFIGGWPGHHTHFTPIPIPAAPLDFPPPPEKSWEYQYGEKGITRSRKES